MTDVVISKRSKPEQKLDHHISQNFPDHPRVLL